MDPTFDPDGELAGELRAGAGKEWVEEAAEDERLTGLLQKRRLSLADVTKDLVNRGMRVSVEFGGHSFSGAVVGAGDDYATVVGSGQQADIRLEAARWSIIPTSGTGTAGSSTHETLRAKLAEYSEQGLTVRLALPGGDMVIGAIAVVAVDHVEVADVDDRQLYVPMGLILAIMRSVDFD